MAGVDDEPNRRLHDHRGLPLGYAGRRLCPQQVRRFGKWKLPRRLPKASILYGFHHLRPVANHTLVIVEGPWGVMRLAQLGIPAIALSQAFVNREEIDWSPVTELGEAAIRALWPTVANEKCCWNVNFPACRAEQVETMEYAAQSAGSIARPRLLPGQDSRGLSYWWLGFDRHTDHQVPDDSDVAVLRRRGVSASPLRGAQRLPGGREAITLRKN